MKKVLYIVSTLKRSGPTSQLYNLVKYLDRGQFEPHILTLSPEPNDSRWKDYEAIGVSLYSLRLSRFLGVFLSGRRLKEVIKRVRPDLLHSQGLRSDMLVASLKIDGPRLITIRNFPQYDYSMTYGRLVGRCMAWLHFKAMRKVELCIGVSRSVSDNLECAFNIVNVETVPNGVDTEMFYPIEADKKSQLRQALGLDLGAEIFISSGHLTIRKDPLFLINFWCRTFPKDLSKRIVFIGSGEQEELCVEASTKAENVFVSGNVVNVSQYLQASDFFVSASRAEGLPNSVLEALACGLPVLLSDIPPHREIIEMAPDIGVLFNLDNPNSFEAALRELLARDRNRMRCAIASLMTERLSARIMSKNYQKLYLKLCGDIAGY